jgi:DNA-binding NtrC family response regulator
MAGAEAMLAKIEQRSRTPISTRWRNAPVLLVQDDMPILQSWIDLLSEMGLRVIAVSSAAEALELPDAIHDLVVLVSDIHGPGMDSACLAAIRKRWPLIRTVLLGENVESGADLLTPGDRFLAKPYLDALLSAVCREDEKGPGELLSYPFLSA